MTTLIRWLTDSFHHTQVWRTDVQKARDGTERRIATGGYAPRDSYELGLPLTTAENRQVRASLLTDPAGTYEIPLRFERLLAAAEVNDGDFQTTGLTMSDWAVAGQRVLVESLLDPDDYYTAEIENVMSAPTITLDTLPPGGMEFLAGYTSISPLVEVLLENGQAIGHRKVNSGYWSLVGRATAQRTSFGDGATVATHSGLPILDRVPSGVELAQEQLAAGVEVLDAGGAIASVWARDVSDIRRSHSWQIDNSAAERQWWKAFLYAARGRQKPFLLPTWQHDLTAVASTGWDVVKTGGGAGFNATAVSVQTLAGNGYVEWRASSTTHEYMCGLSADNPNASYEGIDYAVFMWSSGRLLVYQNGASPFDSGVSFFSTGDLIRVERTGTSIAYKKNGATFYTSLVASSAPLMIDTSIYGTFGETGCIRGIHLWDAGIEREITWTSVANVSTTTKLIVEGPPTPSAPDYVNDWWPSLAHRRVQILRSDGTVAYRAVSAAVDNLDGTQSLTLDAAIVSAIARVSFLELCRLDTDVIVTEYAGPDRGHVQFPALVVQQ